MTTEIMAIILVSVIASAMQKYRQKRIGEPTSMC